MLSIMCLIIVSNSLYHEPLITMIHRVCKCDVSVEHITRRVLNAKTAN